MKILAVSDTPSRSLETMITQSPERFGDVDLVVSCGDLDKGYLEFVAEGTRRPLLFVYGNHAGEKVFGRSSSACGTDRLREMAGLAGGAGRVARHIAGAFDLHGRIELFDGYIVAGFGGTLWYNGRWNQFTEREMARVVGRVARRIRWQRLRDRLAGRPPRKVIVVSHAPIYRVHDEPDVCHTGFRCFREFVDRIGPVLWLHGHVHLAGYSRAQISVVDRTTVVNAYGCRVVRVGDEKVEVFSHCDVDKQEKNW